MLHILHSLKSWSKKTNKIPSNINLRVLKKSIVKTHLSWDRYKACFKQLSKSPVWTLLIKEKRVLKEVRYKSKICDHSTEQGRLACRKSAPPARKGLHNNIDDEGVLICIQNSQLNIFLKCHVIRPFTHSSLRRSFFICFRRLQLFSSTKIKSTWRLSPFPKSIQ